MPVTEKAAGAMPGFWFSPGRVDGRENSPPSRNSSEDFLGLGLGDRMRAKIFSNLVLLGHLRADGTLAVDPAEDLPQDGRPNEK